MQGPHTEPGEQPVSPREGVGGCVSFPDKGFLNIVYLHCCFGCDVNLCLSIVLLRGRVHNGT